MDREYDPGMDVYKYYDRHTIYVFAYEATLDQIKKVIENAINRLGIACAYQINLVDIKDASRYAYIRLSDERVYYAILGFNFDGSERFEEIDDPDFKPPKKPIEEALANIDQNSWVNEEEDIRALYRPKKIKKPLPTLVELIPYDDDDNYLRIMRAFAIEKSYPYENNVIFGSVPTWVNYKMINAYFLPFVTDKNEKKQTNKGSKNYPLIMFKDYPKGSKYANKKKKVFITYSSTGCDANFSLMMNKFITFQHNGQQERVKFDHYMRHENNERETRYEND